MFEEFVHDFPFLHFSDDIRKIIDRCSPVSLAEGVRRLTPGNKLALFGAGDLGRSVPKALDNIGYRVDFFVDNDPKKWGTTLGGIPIVSVDELAKISEKVDLFITCGRVREVVVQLHERGIAGCIRGSLVILDIDEIDPIQAIKSEERDIRRLFSLWEDEMSKNVYYGLLNYHLTGKLDYIFPITETRYAQYFDSDIVHWGTQEFFVDAGAFDGQTTRYFMTTTENRFNKILVFEPNREQYLYLVKKFSPMGAARILVEELALYDEETTLHFGGITSTARIDEFGSEVVHAIPLDLFLTERNIRDKITFLKMDIEGAEVRALKGAAGMIREMKPTLAICVYHRPSDLWRIPLYLHDLVPEYKLYLRHYTNHPTETVCYATVR